MFAVFFSLPAFARFVLVDETSSVKNAFLIGEINFEKKFNTFENDTHERFAKKKRDEIQLKSGEQEDFELRRPIVLWMKFLSADN